jgi:hypothetical protein
MKPNPLHKIYVIKTYTKRFSFLFLLPFLHGWVPLLAWGWLLPIPLLGFTRQIFANGKLSL